MTSEEFIKRIRIAVYDSVVEGTQSLLEKPPGRRPWPKDIALSEWYNKLSVPDQERVHEVVQQAAHFAVFQMLCVIDGVKSIREAGEDVGDFELRYNVGDQSHLINKPPEFLHDIFNAEVPPGR